MEPEIHIYEKRLLRFLCWRGVYKKVYTGLTKRGVYENLLPVGGGSTKIYGYRRGGVYEKILHFDEIRPIPPSDIK